MLLFLLSAKPLKRTRVRSQTSSCRTGATTQPLISFKQTEETLLSSKIYSSTVRTVTVHLRLGQGTTQLRHFKSSRSAADCFVCRLALHFKSAVWCLFMKPLKELQRHASHCWPRAWTLLELKRGDIFHYISHVCSRAGGVTLCSQIPSRLKYFNDCWSGCRETWPKTVMFTSQRTEIVWVIGRLYIERLKMCVFFTPARFQSKTLWWFWLQKGAYCFHNVVKDLQ